MPLCGFISHLSRKSHSVQRVFLRVPGVVRLRITRVPFGTCGVFLHGSGDWKKVFTLWCL